MGTLGWTARHSVTQTTWSLWVFFFTSPLAWFKAIQPPCQMLSKIWRSRFSKCIIILPCQKTTKETTTMKGAMRGMSLECPLQQEYSRFEHEVGSGCLHWSPLSRLSNYVQSCVILRIQITPLFMHRALDKLDCKLRQALKA